MATGLYDATCLVTSARDVGAPIRQPDPELGFGAFVGAIDRIRQLGVLLLKDVTIGRRSSHDDVLQTSTIIAARNGPSVVGPDRSLSGPSQHRFR